MSDSQQEHLDKKGLYAGNVVLEVLPDAKGIKPVIKVNNLATQAEMTLALDNFSFLITEIHSILVESKLPITYLLPPKDKIKIKDGEVSISE